MNALRLARLYARLGTICIVIRRAESAVRAGTHQSIA